jgi:type IV pilus assembly protein PilE
MVSKVNNGEIAMRRTRGFTLIELMVVVVIIAILAAIAIPAYGRYAFRARRVDGQELLLRVANAQERYYATYNHYGSMTDLNYANPAPSEKNFYMVTSLPATAATTQVFTATATPAGAQVNDRCGSLGINNAGAKTPGPASASSNSNGSCW